MRRRLATGVFILLLAVAPAGAQDVESREARDPGSRIIRIIRQVVDKVFRPSSNGDFLSPPRP